MKTKTYWVQLRDNETMPTDHSGGNEVRNDEECVIESGMGHP